MSARTGRASHPRPLLRPGEAAHAANEAAAPAKVDVQGALAWRDFMVSNYSDAGQERWLADNGIDLLRGTGRLAGPGVVKVDAVSHTADQVVLACGPDPAIPPIPGLHGLEGIWTNREVTGMKAVPRRMLVLGGAVSSLLWRAFWPGIAWAGVTGWGRGSRFERSSTA